MTITATHTDSRPDAVTPALVRTARETGLAYLGLAVTGLLGFLLIRSQLFVADDPQATLANLTEHETLARLGVALELGVVLTQALVAVWFYRLFRSVSSVAAGLDRRVRPGQRHGDPRQRRRLAAALDVSTDASLAVDGGRRGDRAAALRRQRSPVGSSAGSSSASGWSRWAGSPGARAGCRACSAGSSWSAASATSPTRSLGYLLPDAGTAAT